MNIFTHVLSSKKVQQIPKFNLMHKSLLLFLFLFSILSFGQSNKLFKKTFTKQNGLELHHVTTMCIDNDGFLWLGGTNNEVRTIVLNNKQLFLQRFNGKSFHNIPLPILAEPINKVGQIYKRNDGKFYIKAVTAIGHVLYLFDPITTIFTRIKTGKSIKDQVQLSNVFTYQEKDYILTQTGTETTINIIGNDLDLQPIFSYDYLDNQYLISASTRIIPFKDYCIIGDNSFPTMAFDWNGKLLQKQDQEAFNHPKKGQTKFWMEDIFKVDSSFYAFIRNRTQLYTIHEETKKITPSDIKNTTLSKTYFNAYNDALGNHIIISLLKREMHFDLLESDGFKTIHTEKVSYSDVDFGFEIVSNNLKEGFWTTYNNELHYYEFPSEKIKTYLKTKSIRSIYEIDTSNYLVSTELKGWYNLNTTTNKVLPLKLKKNKKLLLPKSSRNIIKENDSIIWSSNEGAILKTNIKTLNTASFNHYTVICMERPTDSTIIYGTQNYNLMEFNTNTKTHKPLVATDSLYIYDLEIQKNSNLVVAGTDKGLLTYNLKTKEHKFYNDKTQLEDAYILMCDYHKDYGYLLGTRAGNIIGFNPENESFTTLYKDDLQAGIATILFNKDLWWINTFNGIVSYNPKDKTSTRFSKNEGLSNNEANRYSALKTKDNAFLVGTIQGLNYFRPEDLEVKKDASELVLLQVNKYDKDLKKYTTNFNRVDLESNNPIILPTENRALELHFGLKNAVKITQDYNFRYRLNKKEWVDLKHQNVIQIPNLAAGNYTLEIEALDFSRKKIADSLIITIKSREFIYKTWWFIALISLFIIAILLWMLKQAQIKKLLQENFSQGLIQSQEEERSRIAIELHDSISQQLTLIKKKAQNTNQDEITTLTHNTLEEVRTLSRGLYPPLLKQLGLTESIEQLILDIDKETSLFVSGEVNKIDPYFNEVQALNCYRFIQECINNVLKHAEAKALSVSVIKEQNTITITIEDNGKGFHLTHAKIKNSLGLKTIYERIRILKGELTIDSNPKKGTIITAQIPVKYAEKK
ncbi:ATP-binding protein [Lacinutrix himadriensis]|uniref:sensor histidine kinase n=1 Tax=Lacinutrix himadriensis TaxID=641549 RepID=UPI0013792034|nr:ATP-binding protein [Lacinutrix himadriensis]